jgi:hypothetical protein
MSASFGFTNKNYIKKYPEIFEGFLREAVWEKSGKDAVFINECITVKEAQKLKTNTYHIFANTSLTNQMIPVPLLSENEKLRGVMCDYIQSAHEATKKKLAEMRKTNQIPKSAYEPKKREKEPKIIIFDLKNEKAVLSSRKWLNKTNDSEIIQCFLDSRKSGITLSSHLMDTINKYIKYTLFRECLEDLPLTIKHVVSILKDMIKEKRAAQEDAGELYEMLYGFGVLASMSIPYSERLEMPGFNVFEIMPGGSLIKLPMPYKEIGYEKLGFTKTACKAFLELWGIPNNHTTLNEYYQEIWRFYEKKFEKRYEEKHGIPWRI